MPEYIKAYSWDQWKGDVKFTVASPEDLKELQDQISAMKNQIAARVTESTLNSKVSIVNEKITKMQESIKSLKDEIISALQDGKWKKSFSQEIENALAELEDRFSELNKLLDEKMMEIPRIDSIETNINAIFLAQGDKIKNIIISEGKAACEQIRQQARQSNLLSNLSDEAQNIKWEKQS